MICLKGTLEECLLFSGNVNTKFLSALGGLLKGTQALGHSDTQALYLADPFNMIKYMYNTIKFTKNIINNIYKHEISK